MEINPGTTLLVVFALVCVLPLVIFGVIAFFVVRMSQQRLHALLSPDVGRLETQMADLRQRQPEASTERLLQQIIHQQAIRCGVIGAVTGLGGIYTLPIALPVDIVLSLRIQSALIDLIARQYHHDNSDRDLTIRNYLVMTGSSEITQASTSFLSRLLLRVVGKSFSKLIPIFGAVISFGVNYAIVQFMGRVALRWYATHDAQNNALTA